MIGDCIYIGIDPSLTHTGMVALDNGMLLQRKTIPTKAVKTWCEQVIREREVIHQIDSFLGGFQRTLSIREVHIVVEDYAQGKFMKTVIPTVELGGLLRGLLFDYTKVPTPTFTVDFIHPSTLKKFCTGAGNADKMKVAVSLAQQFGCDFGGDDNLYDSFGLALIAKGLAGITARLTPAQMEIVEKLKGNGNGVR